jgi:hypothetical protein
MVVVIVVVIIIIIIVVVVVVVVIIIIIIVIAVVIVVMVISCHRPFLPGTSLEPTVIPTDRYQVLDCSTFCIMRDVPSIALFCSESIESFPGMAAKFFVTPFVTITVAPIITGIIICHVPPSLYFYT